MDLDEFMNHLKKKIEIKVGFPQDKQITYPAHDRKDRKGGGGKTVAQVAKIQEFGATNVHWEELNNGHGGNINIPARPFLRDALKNNKKEIIKMLMNWYLPKNIGNPKYLNDVGLIMKKMVQNSIQNGNWKPNSPRTIAIKKSSQPLIDRGIMKNSVNYEVKIS